MPTWSRKLSQPIRTTDGLELRTLSEVRAFMLALPESLSVRNSWQHAARLLMVAADGGDIDALAEQVRLALLLELRLEV